MKDRISKEIIDAMKAKDKVRLNVLRFLKKLLIENETSKKPIDEQDVIIGHAKKMADSLSLYPEGSNSRNDLEAEIEILKDYLPEQLSEQDVTAIINEIVSGLENPNMGAVMKELAPKIKGRFDGKLASQLVNNALKP
jgi:uncharacterized protein YqeY